MTLREAIQEYRHFVESMTGDNSDDTMSSDLAVYNKLRTARSVVLDTVIGSGGMLTEEHYQTLRCVELEEEDIVQCPSIPESGCTWLKSTCDIPKTISIKSVTTHLGKQFSYVRWDKIKEKVNGRLPSSRTDKIYTLRTIEDKVYLYVYNDDFVKSITISGIFEDPIVAATFCGDNEIARCNPLEASFHTGQTIFGFVSKAAWETIARERSAAQVKATNNDFPLDRNMQVQ